MKIGDFVQMLEASMSGAEVCSKKMEEVIEELLSSNFDDDFKEKLRLSGAKWAQKLDGVAEETRDILEGFQAMITSSPVMASFEISQDEVHKIWDKNLKTKGSFKMFLEDLDDSTFGLGG